MAKLEDATKLLTDYHQAAIDAAGNIAPKLWSTDGFGSYSELLEQLTTKEQNEAFAKLYNDEKASGKGSKVSTQMAYRVQILTIAAIRRGYRAKMVSGADAIENGRSNLKRKELLNRQVAIGKLNRLLDNKAVNIETESN